MSESKHTPEPWHLCEVENETGRIKHLVPVDAEKMPLLTIVENYQATFAAIYNDDDARRIVACVNACAGMTNEQLDNICMISGSLLNRFGEQMHYLRQVEQQRDELLAALTLIASGEAENGSILSSGECQRIAYDAIVSVKGEQ